MVVDLAAYRQKKARPRAAVVTAKQGLLCVNSGVTLVFPVEAAFSVEPIPSPSLSDVDGDYAAFHTLAYALATHI